ncbi:universal stress protein [Propionivibrio sp.]|uniref:universal stress protein n=1 Tax=Propionivibrio sp. TaxID=2212460 RepID=UPI002622F694|nr:universal stress protein [Propionivibrio sp.]
MSTSDQTESNAKLLRLLVPINAKEDSRWGLQYALRRQRKGSRLEVILLHVGETITQWQVLRFRTQREIAQFQAERAQAFIEEASQFLTANNIPSRGLFKQGELVFSILDTAEELACDEIILPESRTWMSSLFACDVVSTVLHQQRGIPVVLVNDEGNIPKIARTLQ